MLKKLGLLIVALMLVLAACGDDGGGRACRPKSRLSPTTWSPT